MKHPVENSIEILKQLWEVVQRVFDTIIAIPGEITRKFINALEEIKKVKDTISDIAQDLIDKALEGLTYIGEELFEGLVDLVDEIQDRIGDIEKFIKDFDSPYDWIKSLIKKVW